ncbi:carbohydrate kinase [Pedobacter sp. HDW13]|nr:PfkB family carbohydrate kinase [Pedobacter sp. HDW13]QIL37982.1 carbohydrate kinase [Pedobacter sp. HDW13]
MSKNKSIVCFGEILWDNLPTGSKRPGGAPMNVAYHLHKLGLTSYLISSIGNDEPGAELLGFLDSIGVEKEWVQINRERQTSQVVAKINAEHEVSYDIVAPVAWDYIRNESGLEELVKKSDGFVFGSLCSRNEVSRATLLNLLDNASYKVFDVNLRAPHYTPELITGLLKKADMVKINAAELSLIAQWNNIDPSRELDCVEAIFEKFGMSEILITKGRMGQLIITRT